MYACMGRKIKMKSLTLNNGYMLIKKCQKISYTKEKEEHNETRKTQGESKKYPKGTGLVLVGGQFSCF
jgi:hypothetical protein